MSKIYNNITELIGNTPLVRINKLNTGKAEVLAKVEFFNPGGSVKDRVGYNMIKQAMDKKIINQESVLIEPTSGNTGIGLALNAAALGLKLIIVMPETMSIERRKLIQGYGAELVLTPGDKGMKGAIAKAEELAKEYPNSFIPQQFENPDNPLAHYSKTGEEIYRDTEGNVDIFVAGVGTGGTVSGVGKYLKSQNENVKVVAVEPASSPVISKGVAGPHKIQGIGAGFIPKNYDASIVDEVITIEDDEAINTSKQINRQEGIAVGISSGAAMAAALKLSELKENEGKTIVVLLPDTAERYLSTALYD